MISSIIDKIFKLESEQWRLSLIILMMNLNGYSGARKKCRGEGRVRREGGKMEGRKEGREEGRREGRKEGREEGRKEGRKGGMKKMEGMDER